MVLVVRKAHLFRLFYFFIAIRFLRKDDKVGKWIDIGDKRAAEKTSQALREKTDAEKDGEAPTTPFTSPTVYLPNPDQAPTTTTVVDMIVDTTVKEAKTEDVKDDEKKKIEGEIKDEEVKEDEKKTDVDDTEKKAAEESKSGDDKKTEDDKKIVAEAEGTVEI